MRASKEVLLLFIGVIKACHWSPIGVAIGEARGGPPYVLAAGTDKERFDDVYKRVAQGF